MIYGYLIKLSLINWIHIDLGIALETEDVPDCGSIFIHALYIYIILQIIMLYSSIIAYLFIYIFIYLFIYLFIYFPA